MVQESNHCLGLLTTAAAFDTAGLETYQADFALAGWAKPKHMNEPKRINSAYPTLILETSSLLLPWRDPRSRVCFNVSEKGIMVTSQPCGLGLSVGREAHSLWL